MLCAPSLGSGPAFLDGNHGDDEVLKQEELSFS